MCSLLYFKYALCFWGKYAMIKMQVSNTDRVNEKWHPKLDEKRRAE